MGCLLSNSLTIPTPGIVFTEWGYSFHSILIRIPPATHRKPRGSLMFSAFGRDLNPFRKVSALSAGPVCAFVRVLIPLAAMLGLATIGLAQTLDELPTAPEPRTPALAVIAQAVSQPLALVPAQDGAGAKATDMSPV